MSSAHPSGILARPVGVSLGALAGLMALIYLLMPDMPGVYTPLIKAAPLWILTGLAFSAKAIAHKRMLAFALLFSGIGDFLLGLEFAGSFAAGMGAFLIAQLAYIRLFWPQRRAWASLAMTQKAAIGAVLVWALSLGVWLLPLAGVMAPALMVYFSALCLMVLLALDSNATNIAKWGAVLFLLSDSLIGIDRFALAIPERHFAVMGSYYLAQAFLFWGLMRKPLT
jgi:alkenylglycerophosphocholine hydrolase